MTINSAPKKKKKSASTEIQVLLTNAPNFIKYQS